MTNGYISSSNSIGLLSTGSFAKLTSLANPHIVNNILDIGDTIGDTANSSGVFYWANLMSGPYQIEYRLTRRDKPRFVYVDVPDIAGDLNLLNYTLTGAANTTTSLVAYDTTAQDKLFVRKDNIASQFFAGANVSISSSISAGTQSIYVSSFGSGSLDPNANYSITASNAINSIYSQTAISSSWASSSVSSSYAQTGPFTSLVTASLVPITASSAVDSIRSQTAISSSWSSQSFNAATSSFSTASLSSSYASTANTAAFAIHSGDVLLTGSTVPITSSVALIAISGGTQIATGSTVPITASWSVNSITANSSTSASFAAFTYTASQALSANQSVSSSYASNSPQILTGSTLPVTSSVSLVAITSSYATFAQNSQTQTITGSTVPITASVSTTALSSISSSYAEESHTSSFANNLRVKNVLTVVGNITSSGVYIPSTFTQKFATGDGSVWTISTDATGKITYTNDADGGVMSITSDGVLTNSQLQCGLLSALTGSTVSTNRILTTGNASVNGYVQFKTTDTASIYQITASNAVSASWAPTNAGGNNLITGSTVPITSSQAITSSYAQTLQHDPTVEFSANERLQNGNDGGYQVGFYSKGNSAYALGISNLQVYISDLTLGAASSSALVSTTAAGRLVTAGALVNPNDGTITGSITFASTSSTVRNVFNRPMRFWANNFAQDTANDWKVYNSGSTNILHIKNDGGTADYQFTTDGILSATTINANQFKGASTTPTIVSGSGAGFTASVNITGSDTAGQIQVVTGNSPTAGGLVVRVSFTSNYTTVPYVTLWPASATAGALGSLPWVNSTTASFNISASNVMAASTNYVYNYHVIA